MPYFTADANIVIGTKSGHCVQFAEGKPTWVPPLASAEIARVPGIKPHTADAQSVIDSEQAVVAGDVPSTTLATSVVKVDQAAIDKFVDAIAKLVEGGDTADFTANGTPKPKSVARVCGVEPTKIELAESFAAYHRTLQDPAVRKEV